MSKTAIEWTDMVWNCVRGCSRTAPAGSHQSGCGDGTGGGCYAEAQAERIVRMGKGKPTAYDGLVRMTANGPRWTGVVRLVPGKLAAPLSWRTPRRIFVNSMSDLFHERLTNEQIAAVFGVMAACPQHVFQVLTKRARRMREWFEWVEKTLPSCHPYGAARGVRWYAWDAGVEECSPAYDGSKPPDWCWPLPNVWIGTSVENQAAVVERIPDLLRTPAAMRFLSCEPLLGELDLSSWIDYCDRLDKHGISRDKAGRHIKCERHCGLSWVIVGCESGSNARPAKSNWYRYLRDQCSDVDVPYFLKQAEEEGTWEGDNEHECTVLAGPGSHRKPGGIIGAPYLDGVQHLAFPEVRRG